MSNWQGFDQRKICPNCGAYQTSVETKERPSLSSPDVRFSLLSLIGVAVLPIIAVLVLYLRQLNGYLVGLFFVVCEGLVVFFAYRRTDRQDAETIDQQSHEKNLIGYSLYCRNCGHRWEMSTEEWETAGRKEMDNFMNSPSRFPSSNGSSNESFDRIEWKPPNPNRAIFIIIGFTGLTLIGPFLLYGIIWAQANPHHPYANIVNYFATICILFLYDGLHVLINPKSNKIALVILNLVILIGLALAVSGFRQHR